MLIGECGVIPIIYVPCLLVNVRKMLDCLDIYLEITKLYRGTRIPSFLFIYLDKNLKNQSFRQWSQYHHPEVHRKQLIIAKMSIAILILSTWSCTKNTKKPKNLREHAHKSLIYCNLVFTIVVRVDY